MNIYADRGNLLLLERRCAWRGIGFEVAAVSLGDDLDPEAHDLFYLGGGQDRDQRLCAFDLVEHKRDALHAAADAGRVVLAVCGGFQLLGHAYALGDEEIPGVGLVDVRTVREDGPRLIGNVAIEVELPGLDGPRVLAGFENHGGRTHLGAGERPARPRAGRARQHRAPPATRACAAATSSGPTCTARCCPRTPGSPTGSSPRPPACPAARPGSSRSTTPSRTPPTAAPAARRASGAGA